MLNAGILRTRALCLCRAYKCSQSHVLRSFTNATGGCKLRGRGRNPFMIVDIICDLKVRIYIGYHIFLYVCAPSVRNIDINCRTFAPGDDVINTGRRLRLSSVQYSTNYMFMGIMNEPFPA